MTTPAPGQTQIIYTPGAPGAQVTAFRVFSDEARTIEVPLTPTITSLGNGTWSILFATPADGLYYVTTTSGGYVDADDYLVFRFGRLLRSLPLQPVEIRQHLNIPTLTGDAFQEVYQFALAAVEDVENIVGPLTPQVFTETVRSQGRLVVTTPPILQVLAVNTAAGTAVSTVDLRVRAAAGIIDGLSGTGPWTVTYTAGYSTVPAAIRLAVLDLIDLRFNQTQQEPRPNYGDGNGAGDSGMSMMGLLDRRIQASLEPYRHIGGVG